MTTTLDNIENKYSSEFDEIIKHINAYKNIVGYRDDKNPDELYKITINCVDAFAKIAKMCIEFGKFKDQMDYSKFQLHLYGPELLIKSNKTNCRYEIGLDRDGIYLSTDLRHNQNLRYMDDKFWSQLINLSQFEGFEYVETEYTPDSERKRHPDLFKTNKSVVYKIFRKYFFDQTANYEFSDSSSVGDLKISMNGSHDFGFIIRQFCKAFKIMYQLNYKLWKMNK